MAKNSVRIRLKAYEHRILDASAEKIVKAHRITVAEEDRWTGTTSN